MTQDANYLQIKSWKHRFAFTVVYWKAFLFITSSPATGYRAEHTASIYCSVFINSNGMECSSITRAQPPPVLGPGGLCNGGEGLRGQRERKSQSREGVPSGDPCCLGGTAGEPPPYNLSPLPYMPPPSPRPLPPPLTSSSGSILTPIQSCCFSLAGLGCSGAGAGAGARGRQ